MPPWYYIAYHEARILSVCCIVYYQVCMDMFLCINKFTWMIPRFLLCIPEFAWILPGCCIVYSNVCLDAAGILYCAFRSLPGCCLDIVLCSLEFCLDDAWTLYCVFRSVFCVTKFTWTLPGYSVVYFKVFLDAAWTFYCVFLSIPGCCLDILLWRRLGYCLGILLWCRDISNRPVWFIESELKGQV